ncbi:MAG: hypothetical protein GF320_14870 [Armatimonadia bacterium]|nr:hypothetical protein [Armatimonadia bacterium]
MAAAEWAVCLVREGSGTEGEHDRDRPARHAPPGLPGSMQQLAKIVRDNMSSIREATEADQELAEERLDEALDEFRRLTERHRPLLNLDVYGALIEARAEYARVRCNAAKEPHTWTEDSIPELARAEAAITVILKLSQGERMGLANE